MFLKTILLVHHAGSTYDEVDNFDNEQLEISVRNFVYSDECPAFIRGEYEESQTTEEDSTDVIDDDPLQREPEQHNITNEQDDVMGLMKTIQPTDVILEELEDDHYNVATDHEANWDQDRIDFGLTDDDLKSIPTWLESKKKEEALNEPSQDMEPPVNFNKEQMNAFGIIKYFIDCKADPNNEDVKQLLLQINGPAGSGKSYWIQKVKGYSKHIFIDNNYYVYTSAPSGTAAFFIKGETLHSLLMLPIDYKSFDRLNSDHLHKLQQKFEKNEILIIDEKSMIGQRLFHMLDMRLREIFPHRREVFFGGLSIVLIGDWKQLPPVGDASLYDADGKCAAGYNLYSTFTDVVTFSKVERQSGDLQKNFREELGRLAEGKFTKDDWNKWKTRTLDLLPPSEQEDFNLNATMACSEKKNMVEHNLKKVKANGQPIAVIHAQSNCQAAKEASSEKACGLVSELVVNKNSVVRLTSNLWTKAGLTNGAKGVVKGIIYAPGCKPPSLPICLIVVFEKYYGPPFIESLPKSVPICPVRREWFSQKKTFSRTMLPLILGYALSIHKLQGETLDKVILNIGNREFSSGLSLVGASRVRSFEGLAFSPFPNYERFEQINKSKALKRRIDEENRLEVLHKNTLCKYHDVIEKCKEFYNL